MGWSAQIPNGLMSMTLSEIGAIASLLLNIGIAIVGATWGIAKIKDAVRDAMDEHKRDVYRQVDTLKREADDRYAEISQSFAEQLGNLSRQFADTFAALRQKINDVELDSAKTFMRRESFYQVKAEMSSEIREFRSDLKDRLDRLENKIDTKT